MKNEQRRCWCFTINNWTKTDVQELSLLFSSGTGPDYIIAGKEVGDKGTPHLQCFAYWSQATAGQRFSYIRKRLTRAAQIEPMYSSVECCLDYCSKDKEKVNLTWLGT